MFETTSELNNYLAPNERVLWQGQGKRRLNSTAASGLIVLAVFSALVSIFVVLLIVVPVSSRSRGDSMAFVILPIILIIVGASISVPLLMLGRRSGNARYYVTTASVGVMYPASAWSGRRVTILPLKNLQQITLSENRDGTGTLTFGQSLMAGYGRYSNSGWTDSTPAFSNIEQPQDIYQLIRKQMAEA